MRVTINVMGDHGLETTRLSMAAGDTVAVTATGRPIVELRTEPDHWTERLRLWLMRLGKGRRKYGRR